mmetsp:Transcript_39216/g.64174  ORF Transcript_39216/g.64174 Transcript_39216/m.64174 type:complete len:292 (-) Transcript_39216:585-1460(-)
MSATALIIVLNLAIQVHILLQRRARRIQIDMRQMLQLFLQFMDHAVMSAFRLFGHHHLDRAFLGRILLLGLGAKLNQIALHQNVMLVRVCLHLNQLLDMTTATARSSSLCLVILNERWFTVRRRRLNFAVKHLLRQLRQLNRVLWQKRDSSRFHTTMLLINLAYKLNLIANLNLLVTIHDFRLMPKQFILIRTFNLTKFLFDCSTSILSSLLLEKKSINKAILSLFAIGIEKYDIRRTKWDIGIGTITIHIKLDAVTFTQYDTRGEQVTPFKMKHGAAWDEHVWLALVWRL